MEILYKILEAYKNVGITRVIFCEEAVYELIEKQFLPENISFIPDVRSATFFAFGEAKLLCKPVLVCVDERYIASAYTSLTESWMQRIPVCVLAYNSTGYRSTMYLEKCTDEIQMINHEKDIDPVVSEALSCKGPTLVKYTGCVTTPQKKLDYSKILRLIRDKKPDTKVYCYEPEAMTSDTHIESISERHKYGVFSKYIGSLLGGEDAILCIPDYLMLLESNAFVLRNIPSTFKLVVKEAKGNICSQFVPWMESNHFNVLNGKTLEENIESMSTSNNPSVIITQ